MAFIQYLTFDGEALPEPDSYEVSMEDVEADSSGETEAGTTQRDVVRFGVHTISVSFTVTAKWLKKLTAYKQQAKIVVDFTEFPTAYFIFKFFSAHHVHTVEFKGSNRYNPCVVNMVCRKENIKNISPMLQ